MFAILFAISFTASAPRNAYARSVKPPTARAKEKAVGTPNGTVLGTLTINGRPVKLRYVYARKRLAPPPGDPSFYSGKLPLTEVIITNQPLSEDTLTSIL